MIVAWIFGIYAAIVVLCNVPFMQHKFAYWTAKALEDQLNTEVRIGSINVGLLNNIIINDLEVKDLSHKDMLKIARVSASVNLFQLIGNGKIEISTAQLFGTKANIYKNTPDSPFNFQFVIDAFKSDDKESSPINLQINSLIVRHANINFDILSEQRKTTIDPNHLRIENTGFNLSIKKFTPDSLNVSLKRFSVKEANSGVEIKDLAFKIEGSTKEAKLRGFTLSLPHTNIEIDSLNANYSNYREDKSFSIGNTEITASICPSDFKFLSPKVGKISEVLNLSTTFSISNKTLDISKLLLTTNNNSIKADIIAKANNFTSDNSTFDVKINNLAIAEGEIENVVSKLTENIQNFHPLFNVGSITYKGFVTKNTSCISSEGNLFTDAGNLTYSAEFSNEKILEAKLETQDIDVKKILNDEKFGNTSFGAEAIIDLSGDTKIPVGKINATINNFDYNDYNYSNINLEAINNATDISVKAISEDKNILFDLDATLSNFDDATKSIIASLNVHNLNLKELNIATPLQSEAYAFKLNANASYTDMDNFSGNASFHDVSLFTSNGKETVESINLDANINGSNNQHIQINSDFLDAKVTGSFKLEDLVSNFQNVIAHHLPSIIESKAVSSHSDIHYDISFRDAKVLHNFIDEDYALEEPITITGLLNSSDYTMNLTCKAPKATIGTNRLENINLNCSSSDGKMIAILDGCSKAIDSNTDGKIIAIAHNNKIDADIQLHNKAKDDFKLNLFSTALFTKNDGDLMTKLNILKSDITINDDSWIINPSTISYCDKQVECKNFRISNGNQYLEIEGKASPNPNDSLIVRLNGIEVAYILDLVNFHSVEFGGKASGHAIVNNIFGKPDANASLFVQEFSLEGGVMGDANIFARWDKEKEGIAVNAHIVDDYMSQIGLSGIKIENHGVTDVNGYILPGKEQLNLNVNANNTPGEFLTGFLGSIFNDIDAKLTGNVSIAGPFSDINIIGDVAADMSFQLAATKVPYVVKDTVHLRYHAFDFEDITLHDKQNNVGVLNGKMTHNNLANFTYDFKVDITNLCAYNETEFNADKYLAQVWANGDIHVYGSDGHPMYIDANVTPCKGSLFAYDSATPDALISNSFIDFHDITDTQQSGKRLVRETKEEHTDSTTFSLTTESESTFSSMTARESTAENGQYEYVGDLYMNINAELNPNCEIKLRMDNTKDGYISTFGNGIFQAKYYNKGSFQLFGNYNITSGKYRLYLQDLVYRNLDIQNGSKVEFNGNPFDANIHLICKHEINSVPLSDLTATKAFTSNNKVKVDCFLDITGHLDNMNLAFSFNLPNVSEETRQLVRSMINSDEEMNKQMIYLLGFQRFYPTDLAQGNTTNYGTQAVNSLLSSTISGQINQMLSNMIGTQSKWNFGTGITTGENGWQDLDVEGMLSGRLLNDRLLINGNFGYRDNSLTNQANFIGDFEVKYRIWDKYDFYVKAYNQTNDRYFTKATLNTQGVGLSFQHDFEKFKLFNIFRKKSTQVTDSITYK